MSFMHATGCADFSSQAPLGDMIGGRSNDGLRDDEIEKVLLESYEIWRKASASASDPQHTAGNMFSSKPPGRCCRIGWWNIQYLGQKKAQRDVFERALLTVIRAGGMPRRQEPTSRIKISVRRSTFSLTDAMSSCEQIGKDKPAERWSEPFLYAKLPLHQGAYLLEVWWTWSRVSSAHKSSWSLQISL